MWELTRFKLIDFIGLNATLMNNKNMTKLLKKLQDNNFLKNIETMTDWIDFASPATQVMDSIEFNIFLSIIFFFNYIIKIDAYKIKHQPKNRYLFEIIIPRKQKKINNAFRFLTNPILNDKIKKI